MSNQCLFHSLRSSHTSLFHSLRSSYLLEEQIHFVKYFVLEGYIVNLIITYLRSFLLGGLYRFCFGEKVERYFRPAIYKEAPFIGGHWHQTFVCIRRGLSLCTRSSIGPSTFDTEHIYTSSVLTPLEVSF
ncbi:hypothetical protein K7X08_036004 [Anisodus acutangulus]|uniref:Uncharacterized protein n=1 Tax=Anisodus acutangulus TaxID=402998 RepID=A0A9Q1L8Q7_9SOLA|nr:hypothetical protein K7X08_036004 [Anisodus acutangulus]